MNTTRAGTVPGHHNLFALDGEVEFTLANNVQTRVESSQGGFMFWSWKKTRTYEVETPVNLQGKHLDHLQGLLVKNMLAGIDWQ